jgi:hypothetical protein
MSNSIDLNQITLGDTVRVSLVKFMCGSVNVLITKTSDTSFSIEIE